MFQYRQEVKIFISIFWLQISIFPAISLIRDKHRDKFPEVSVVLGTVSSFFIFYIFHATLVFGRHFYDLSGNEISTYNLWMIKVNKSLTFNSSIQCMKLKRVSKSSIKSNKYLEMVQILKASFIRITQMYQGWRSYQVWNVGEIHF